MVSSRTSEPIVAQLSFSLLDNLAPGFSIRQGTRIATLRLREENIYGCRDGCGTFAWNLIADNDAYFVTTGCNINARQPINVTFNNVRQDRLTTSAASARIVQEKQLTYQCGGSDSGAQDIDIRLISDAAPFSTELIKTSNANVGIALMYNGKQIAPNASFRTRIVNGRGSDTVSFNMVKNNVAYADIATGPLSGSATLILSPP